jgi:hypothetical protein
MFIDFIRLKRNVQEANQFNQNQSTLRRPDGRVRLLRTILLPAQSLQFAVEYGIVQRPPKLERRTIGDGRASINIASTCFFFAFYSLGDTRDLN